MSQSFIPKVYVPPGAQEKTLDRQRQEALARVDAAMHEAHIQAQLAAQRERVEKIQASKKEMLYSPLGLRALFPTNQIKVKLRKKGQRPAVLHLETPAAQLEERAAEAADPITGAPPLTGF